MIPSFELPPSSVKIRNGALVASGSVVVAGAAKVLVVAGTFKRMERPSPLPSSVSTSNGLDGAPNPLNITLFYFFHLQNFTTSTEFSKEKKWT